MGFICLWWFRGSFILSESRVIYEVLKENIMLTKTLYYASYFFGLLGILYACLSYSVWHYPYDETGRYFEPVESIVYHQQTLEVYVVMAVVCLALTVVFLTAAFL